MFEYLVLRFSGAEHLAEQIRRTVQFNVIFFAAPLKPAMTFGDQKSTPYGLKVENTSCFIFNAVDTEVRGVGPLYLSLSLHLSLTLGLGLGLKISNLGLPCSPAPSLDVVLEN